MNDIDFPYVVLRNWENLPNSVELGEHSDLDLLVYDIDHWMEIYPNAERPFDFPRVQFRVPIADSFIQVDVRHIGDGYYPVNFEEAILNTREWNEKGFWTPNALHHRLGLAYHAVHHKGYNAYKNFLGETKVEDLLKALKKSKIGWVAPTDYSVGSFHQYWKGATSTVSNAGDSVIKSQSSYEGYDLIANEKRILSECDSRHFPKIISDHEDGIEIEHCGDQLTADNLPEDWKNQFVEILDDLIKYKIQHRDIRPQNLMVKDGVIKLIDFGWARFVDDEKDNPPSCLGYPYKPSHGFDDQYSLATIARKIRNSCASLV